MERKLDLTYMKGLYMQDALKLSIFHPTDFSESSSLAFVHALKLSLICGKKLTIMHTGSRENGRHRDWHKFPRVRDTLERWCILEKGSSRSSVYDTLRLKVTKKDEHEMNPLAAIAVSPTPTVICFSKVSNAGKCCKVL